MSQALDGLPLEHHTLSVNGVELHTVVAGEGPLVVLLHGFPEFWFSWRHQIPALVAAGYRVAVPDQRGYNLSSKPRGSAAYRVGTLARDVLDLATALGGDRFHLVGHDWGGAVAWHTAQMAGDRLLSLSILNVPHPRRMAASFRTLRQLRKSWYMFFFQLPWLPERAIRAGGFAGLRRMLARDPARPGAFTDEDVQRYVAALAQEGAVTGAVNWYRAAFRRGLGQTLKGAVVQVPTQVIWGQGDRYLGEELAEPGSSLVPDCRVLRIPDASHWVQVDAPDAVNQALLEFFASHGGAS